MKRKLMLKTFITFLCAITISFGQMKKVTGPNMGSEADIYEDENGTRYSTIINLKFDQRVISLEKGLKEATAANILNTKVKDLFLTIQKKYGDFKLIKEIPSAEWGDVERVNRRTGKKVIIPDLSQQYKIVFSNLIPVDSIIIEISKLNITEYVEGPVIIFSAVSPNDYFYINDKQWGLEYVEAEKAWNVAKGDNITISINDWYEDTSTNWHDEIKNKIDYSFTTYRGGHGVQVGGIVAAQTNNTIGVASLGWNTRLMIHGRALTSQVSDAVTRGADIINFSWQTESLSWGGVIQGALQQGVVCVAAVGNNAANIGANPPVVRYPAAHNFGEDGQVIAVSATYLNSGSEEFIPNYNYSPGTDPIGNPTNGFVDVSAPGGDITTLDVSSTSGYLENIWGTSLSAPMVSALVALIFSINSSVDVNDVYEIVTKSAEKIGQYPYSYVNNTWNQYLGYGRINAYEALKYTLENYGGSLSQDLTIPFGETWSFKSGVTIKFTTGKGIKVDGTLNATNTTFTSSGSSWGGIQFRSGSSGILDGCTIENVYTYGGAAFSMIGGGSATVKNCTIENNSSSHGISIINTGTSVPYIYNNTIRNNTLSGIYIYNGNAYLRYNNITGPSSSGHAGVKCDYFSTPLFAAPSGGYEEGWNTLQNGYHGLWGNYHCNINAGSSTNGYNNTFSNNTYANVRASSYTTISAKKNWWSPNPPSRVIVDGTSSVDYSPYNQWQDAITTGNSKNSIGENSITSLSSLSQAREFLFQKDYQSAFDIYKQIINSKINEKEVMLAISDLYFLYKAYSIPGVLTLLDSIISSKEDVKEYKPLALEVISNLFLYDKSEPDFLLFNTKLREYSRNTIHELHGIVDLFYYHFNKKEFDEAFKVIESVSEKFSEEDNVKFAQWLINSELGIENSSTSKFGNGITSAEDNSKPKEFRLFGNYPNPFNPTTKISFSIPVQAQVELAVYDVLGRKVSEVVNETLNAGEYEVEFDGSGLASGLYIYKLTSGNFTDSKKMLILK